MVLQALPDGSQVHGRETLAAGHRRSPAGQALMTKQQEGLHAWIDEQFEAGRPLADIAAELLEHIKADRQRACGMKEER